MAEIGQEREDEAVQTVCEARARMIGAPAATVDERAAMRRQSHGEAAGRALVLSEGGDKGERLFAAYKALTGAYERYCRIVLGASPHAKTGKIEMARERLTTSAEDAPPDLRTEDERHRAAGNAWASWKGRLEAAGMGHASALWSAYYGWVDLHHGRDLTAAGQRFVAAMCALEDKG